MKAIRSIALAGAVIATTLTGTALAAADTMSVKIPFTATYAGKAVTTVNDGIADISSAGKGTATLIGAGKIAGKGKGDSTQQPCVPFSGTGAMTGPRGTVSFKVVPTSVGCGDEAGQQFSITGRATVTRATGKLAKARGTLKFKGRYDRGSGSFSIKFTGTLTR